MSLCQHDKDADNANRRLVLGIRKGSLASAIAVRLAATACLINLAACAMTGAETTGHSRGMEDYSRVVADGRTFASLKCASCHALDRSDLSANWDAPPMKELLPHLEFKMLERNRVQDAIMSHGKMPALHLSMLDKEALVAYLESIADPPGN